MKNSLSNKYVYPILVHRIRNKEKLVLATVMETFGSSPQKSGSSAIFNKSELLEGTIGGGIVEHTIQKESQKAIVHGKSGFFSFDMNEDIDKADSSICGGGMNILLDAQPEKQEEIFKALNNSFQKRIPGVLLTIARKNLLEELELERRWVTKENFTDSCKGLSTELIGKLKEVLEGIAGGKSFDIISCKTQESAEELVFLECIIPPVKLIIAGAGHVAKALSPIAKLLDFEVTVWDDRPEWANKNNFPDADLVLKGDFEQSLRQLNTTSNTFVVIVTRGHKSDAIVLKKFIGSEVAYIGMIGSRIKIAQVKDLFLKNSWCTAEQWEKIHAPIGLNIHSKTTQEIAISIAAQLINERYKLAL